MQREVQAEVDEILGGRPPQSEDLGRLAFTRRVFTEALPMYPSAWLLTRRATTDVDPGGHRIPAGSQVCYSPYALHRDPAVYPDRFDPGCWLPDPAGAPRNTYLPFGAGQPGVHLDDEPQARLRETLWIFLSQPPVTRPPPSAWFCTRTPCWCSLSTPSSRRPRTRCVRSAATAQARSWATCDLDRRMDRHHRRHPGRHGLPTPRDRRRTRDVGLTGLVSIGLGVVLFVHPDIGALSLATVFGLFSLFYDISAVVLYFQHRQATTHTSTPSSGRAGVVG